mmetsp:Transcript_41807/g.108286  ORF Transcript_41807/g.108286 Transcript_41807/m.108286 type:complete len:322 (+) Transcript_41807:67-1032(+)
MAVAPPPGLEEFVAEADDAVLRVQLAYEKMADLLQNEPAWNMTAGVGNYTDSWSGAMPGGWPGSSAMAEMERMHNQSMHNQYLPNPWAPETREQEAGLLGEGVLNAMLASIVPNEEARTVNGSQHIAPAAAPIATCRWHDSANKVGIVSGDGHVFTKTSGGHKVVTNSRGMAVELPSICMVFDQTLRCGGTHQYTYQLLDGELGVADGAGFVFDSKVRRKNIQQMRSVFLNQRGRVCLRDHEHILKLGAQLPPLTAGMWLTLQIDLDSLHMHLAVYSPEGYLTGITDFSVDGLFKTGSHPEPLNSGFFCAVMTRDVSVALA